MNTQEYNEFKEFIRKLKYDIMSLDDYEVIFNRLGGNGVIHSKQSEQWILYTMCHNVDPFEGSPKLYFYTETRTLYCYTKCNHSMDIFGLISKRFALKGENKSIYQSVKWLCEQLKIPFNFKSENIKTENNMYNWKSSLGKYLRNGSSLCALTTYDKDVLDYFNDCYHDSWCQDNISILSMQKYQIKYYPWHDSVIIPCFDTEGNLCGIRERFLNPNTNVKYLPLSMLDGTSYNFPVNRTLYGLNFNAENIRKYKKVVLFEAEKSTLQTDTYFSCKNFSVSLYGKSMSKAKLKQLLSLGIEEVVIGLDFDYENVTDANGEFTLEFEDFKRNVYRIGDYFKPHCKVTAMISYEGHNKNDSPSDLGKEKYLELFNNRESLY